MKKNIKKNRIFKWLAIIASYIFALNILCVSDVFATDDPLTVIDNLSTFIFGIIRAIGMILLGWGIVQIGLALKSHDASQRANRIFDISRRSNYYFFKRNIKPYNRWLIIK